MRSSDAQVVLVGNRLHDVLIVLERQVRDDHPTDTTLHTTLAESLDTVVQDGIQITHEHERDLHLVLDFL